MRLGRVVNVSGTRSKKRTAKGLMSATSAPSLLTTVQAGYLGCAGSRRGCVRANGGEQGPSAPPGPERGLKRTMADLDAVLGVVDEALTSSNPFNVSMSASAESAAFEADVTERTTGSSLFPDTVQKQMNKISQRVQGILRPATNVPSPMDYEGLLKELAEPDPVCKEDVRMMRESVFGNRTFSVTDTVPYAAPGRAGVVFRGRLRDDRDKVYASVSAKVQELFAGRYEVILMSDLESAREDEALWSGSGTPPAATPGGVPVAFLILPAAQAGPPPQSIWKKAAGVATGVILAGACSHLGVMANFAHIPQDLINYLEHPRAYPPLGEGMLPPGFEQLDVPAYLAVAVPLAGSLFAVNAVHEVGHHLAAFVRKVKLGSALYVPSLDVGSFGAITPFASLLKGHRDLWDVAAAGPLAGMACSVAVLGLGLLQSHSGVAKELLMNVPSSMFQGSLLLGATARMVLGDEVLRAAEVSVSPLVVAGWCGVVVNSLQLLPVGSLDGGRLVQAVWGKQCLRLTSAFTYMSLGLGLLATDLAVPFGLYVFFCQREAENFIKDNVTSAGSARQTATLVAMLTAVLVLLPMAPEVADTLGMGGPLAL